MLKGTAFLCNPAISFFNTAGCLLIPAVCAQRTLTLTVHATPAACTRHRWATMSFIRVWASASRWRWSVNTSESQLPSPVTVSPMSTYSNENHALLEYTAWSGFSLSLSLSLCVCVGSSTVDLLIYQTLCYALDDLDVCEYLLKVCGHDEYLDK